MDFNKLQKNWRKAENSMTSREEHEFNPGRKTTLERLAIRYRSFSVFSMGAAICFAVMFILGKLHDVLEFPTWFIICFEVYFLIASLMDYWLYQGVKSIDCSRMTVEEVLRKTLFYRKRHLQFMAVLIPCALTLMISMGIMLKADPYVIYGMIAGFIFGVAIGVKYFLAFMHDYHTLLG